MSTLTRLGLLTHLGLPQLDPDDQILKQELLQRGYDAKPVAWDDPGVSWSELDLVVVRSPWNYYLEPFRFFAWIEKVGNITPFENPPRVLRWSLEKRYLFVLEQEGVAIVPTILLPKGSKPDVEHLRRWAGPNGLVLKPAIGADSFLTVVVPPENLGLGQAHLDQWLCERDFLCQPFLPSVEEPGERCLVLFDGEYSHAVQKNALTRGGRWAGLPEGVPVEVTAEERETANRILRTATSLLGLERPPLYARVDLLPVPGGSPLLLELELAEPTLFFSADPDAAKRFVDSLEARTSIG